MPQGALLFKYENQTGQAGMTALGGLPVYLDLAQVLGLSESVDRHLKVRTEGRGFTDSEVVMSLILLNLAGGDCVEDIRVLERDEGFCRVLRRTQTTGLKWKERSAHERRFRKERKRTFPSPSSIFRYLEAFHDAEEEKRRKPGEAFISSANEHLRGFGQVNADFLAFMQRHTPQRTATLDMDATLVETNKSDVLFCYKGYRAYQPFNTWWAEQGVVLHTEFRDGNVPAGFEQTRLLEEALALFAILPPVSFCRSSGSFPVWSRKRRILFQPWISTASGIRCLQRSPIWTGMQDG